MTAEHLDLVGPAEIAARINVPRSTVLGWKHRGLLPEPYATVSDVPLYIWDHVAETARNLSDARNRLFQQRIDAKRRREEKANLAAK